jgi:hypothetical protein
MFTLSSKSRIVDLGGVLVCRAPSKSDRLADSLGMRRSFSCQLRPKYFVLPLPRRSRDKPSKPPESAKDGCLEIQGSPSTSELQKI